jgi:hypothetical protein
VIVVTRRDDCTRAPAVVNSPCGAAISVTPGCADTRGTAVTLGANALESGCWQRGSEYHDRQESRIWRNGHRLVERLETVAWGADDLDGGLGSAARCSHIRAGVSW